MDWTRMVSARACPWAAAVLGAILFLGLPRCGADDSRTPPPLYKPPYPYPVMDEMRKAREEAQARRDSLKRMVDQRYEQDAERKRKEGPELRLDWSGIDRPGAPEEFASAFHLPPVPQYNTGTCWAFCSTSFFESEVFRLTGREVKLSEMWTVYWEYVEKARRFVREYGHSSFGQGSEDEGTREVYRLYGAVPAEAYRGLPPEEERHDHELLSQEIQRYLDWVKDHNYWDEGKVIAYVRTVLDAFCGRPPEIFTYLERSYTPLEFLDQVLGLRMDDYILIQSTLAQPFGAYTLFDVPDNWRRSTNYLNLPLDAFYEVFKSSIQAGYTVSLGGDTSEPGVDGMVGAAVIPTWDLPSDFIDQGSREHRIDNETTTDDHGIHAVGYCRRGERDWFLVKDSNQSSRLGRHKGYYFFDGDFVRLKMLSYMVHRDRLAGRLPG